MSEIETPRRRWFQFRLRTLMLAVTLAAVLLGSGELVGTCVVVLVMFYAMLFAVRNQWDHE